MSDSDSTMGDGDRNEMGEAARRGLRRAGVHLVKAAIEVVAGVGALIEELKAAGEDEPDSDGDTRQRIDLD